MNESFIDRGACPLCGMYSTKVYIDFPQIPVVQCEGCGFIFSSKVQNDEMMTTYYQETFAGDRHLKGQIVNSKINIAVLSWLIKNRNLKNFLDIGTGYGFLLKEAKNIELYGVGVELSKAEAAFANDVLGLLVINNSLDRSDLAKESFDLVTCFEVIEHVSDPLNFINEMIQYVRPGGLVLIMTDNFQSNVVNSLGAGFPKWIPHAHVSHFSAATLRQAIESIGNLTIISEHYYTPWEHLLRRFIYRIRKIKKSPSEAFDLSNVLAHEMTGNYKFFRLRKFINSFWMRLTLSTNPTGAVMYFLAKKS